MRDLNLLSDRLISTATLAGLETMSLPDLLAALAADRVRSFPALRPHQRHAWHVFLAQLGAIALHAAGVETPPEDAEGWRALLRRLTDDYADDAPWRLVVDDHVQSAFLQPPAPPGARPLKHRIETPDALDVLVTARNFDVKRAMAAGAAPEDWIFVLVSLQTMEGFLGAGNYGIARMNGGFSARPFLGLAPAEGGVGAHLRRDWRAMLARREDIAEDRYPTAGGLALLWLEPWDGRESLRLDRLDPFFIEICRRVRLVEESGRVAARAAGTAAPRVEAKALQGLTGDFWAPVNAAEGKAFSLTEGGWSARTLCRLLFDKDHKVPPALDALPEEKRRGGRLVARGVARGQGKTEGWHERVVPLGPRVTASFGDADVRVALGRLAEAQLKETRHVAQALRLACAVLASGGSGEKPSQDDYAAAAPYVARLDAEAEARFFAALQDRFAEKPGAREGFLRPLKETAEALLEEAATTIPCPALRRPRAGFRARRAFRNALFSSKGPLGDDRDLLERRHDA